MKLNFCTLFDSNYLSRGLAMYRSLEKNCDDFHLYLFVFDELCAEIILKMNLLHVTVIRQNEFETPELLAVKPSRSRAEYCWTCTSSIILHCIEKYNLAHCTYIDADLLFYSNPKILLEEMGEKSVMITEHRYTPEYDQTKVSGKYCVQFMVFKNNPEGMKVLRWWKDACIDWCFAKPEDGKFGDQKYLDDWTVRFDGVHELQHIGGGVAPWNLQQYDFMKRGNQIYMKEKNSEYVPLVFCHFHDIHFYTDDVVCLTFAYHLPEKIKQWIYFPYIKNLMEQGNEIKKINNSFSPHAARSVSPREPYTMRDKFHIAKDAVLKKKNFSTKEIMASINENYFYRPSRLTKWHTS